MTAAIRLEVAVEKVSEMPEKQLRRLKTDDAVWTLACRVGVPFFKLVTIVRREQLKRGILALVDLTPSERRAFVDPASLDLHAIASGPIMDAGEIYLPAGKLSLAETKAREASQVERFA